MIQKIVEIWINLITAVVFCVVFKIALQTFICGIARDRNEYAKFPFFDTFVRNYQVCSEEKSFDHILFIVIYQCHLALYVFYIYRNGSLFLS